MRSRMIVAGGLALAVSISAHAGELGIGDPAPKLEVSQWVKGQSFDPAKSDGKGVYVVEFWATWCAPCVASVPHLTELQHRFADKGLRIVGVTEHRDDNTLEIVKQFVDKQGEKLDYAIAFDKDGAVSRAYMEASGQDGIPTAFVIEQQGRIAWIGHPMDGLDEVIEEVVSGKFDIERARKLSDVQRSLWASWQEENWEAVFKAARAWAALEPGDATPHLVRFQILAHDLGKTDAARDVLVEAVKALHDHADGLAALASEISREEPEQGIAEVALQAAARALELEPNHADALMARFYILGANNRTDEAVASAEDAINRMKGNPEALGAFARLLSSPEHAERCDKLALRAVDLAIAADPAAASHLVTKFDIQAICQSDLDGARATGRYLIQKAGDDANLLNSFAWSLLDDERKKGKFDKLALEVAERANRLTDGAHWSILDTLALAKFVNGARAEAITLQKKAVALCENPMFRYELQGRLDMFENESP